jgi:hypothetical protein
MIFGLNFDLDFLGGHSSGHQTFQAPRNTGKRPYYRGFAEIAPYRSVLRSDFTDKH